MKLNFDGYIELIDRMLERRGFSTAEREIIFDDNGQLILNAYNKRINPTILIDKINTESVLAMYEGKRKPSTAKGKTQKFKKVMGEFGKGKLKPYRAKSSLKSKKQGGSEKDRKQALAIAYSEAGLSEAKTHNYEITPGMQYAISFLKTLGLKLISTPLQLSKGTLEFIDDDRHTKWQISGSGYIRKISTEEIKVYLPGLRGYSTRIPDKWQMVYSHFGPQYQFGINRLNDDEYMDLAEIISQKIGKIRKKSK